jgi:hypothetical protein
MLIHLYISLSHTKNLICMIQLCAKNHRLSPNFPPPSFYCPQHQILSSLYSEMQLASRIHWWNRHKYSDKLSAEDIYDVPVRTYGHSSSLMTTEQKECKEVEYCACLYAEIFAENMCWKNTAKILCHLYPALVPQSPPAKMRSQLNPITLDVTCNSVHTVRNFVRICKPVQRQQGTCARETMNFRILFTANLTTPSGTTTAYWETIFCFRKATCFDPNGPSLGFL